jgi:hypothetical protein
MTESEEVKMEIDVDEETNVSTGSNKVSLTTQGNQTIIKKVFLSCFADPT